MRLIKITTHRNRCKATQKPKVHSSVRNRWTISLTMEGLLGRDMCHGSPIGMGFVMISMNAGLVMQCK